MLKDIFVRNARELPQHKHQKYDYSAVPDEFPYKEKINIICLEHGSFSQRPGNHLKGQGCPACGKLKYSKNIKKGMENILERCIQRHHDFYSYIFPIGEIKTQDFIDIICPVHGKFRQKINNHLNGNGCPSCGILKSKIHSRISIKELLSKFFKLYGDKYTYHFLSDNPCVCDSIAVICLLHGGFETKIDYLLHGNHCAACGVFRSSEAKYLGKEKFLSICKKHQKEEYDYSLVPQKFKMRDKIRIICPVHKEFEQVAWEHSRGARCPTCAHHISQAETSIADYINYFSPVMRNDRKIINPLELDIVLPEQKTAIEYCGIHWHSDARQPDKNYHLTKLERANAAGYRLITIFENEWLEHTEQVKAILRRAAGEAGERVFARKCRLSPVSKRERIAFFEQSHIQGDFAAPLAWGLYRDDELLACMSFKRSYNCVQEGQFELTRFAVKDGFQVIGAGGRLFKAFLRSQQPQSIISYCDRRLFEGGLYKALGFEQTRILPPDYWYVKGQRLFNKRVFRHGNFGRAHERGILPEWKNEWSEKGNPCYKTEREIMELNNYNRIWDCGKLVFEWKKQTVNTAFR